jgi:H+/Cl- antiporter ClcA
MWWPLPLLTISGLLVALAIRYFPGTGGHLPAEGLKTGGIPVPVELPGIFFAALAGLALGAVIGPEAPLIALGGGLAVVAVKLAKRDAPDRTVTAVAAAGSFAAVSALLGSPILGAFLLMEAAGLGGIMMDLVLLPGLVASGTGALIFVGLGSWTGLGTNSLVIPNLPHFARPDAAEFGWAIVIGLGAAVVGAGVRWLGLYLQDRVKPRIIQLTPLVGLAVAGLAIAYAEGTGKGTSDVLFSGQSALPTLLAHSATYSVGALVLLLACKGLAYGLSLSSFRGGPIFPSLFLGAAGGIALSHAPGLPMVAGAAMGMGALMVAMLRLPLTSVLLATLLLLSDGLAVMPLVIVAVAIAFVASSKISPVPPPAPATPPATATPADEAVPASRT